MSRTPAWDEYWSDRDSPHPDAAMAQKQATRLTGRVWMPPGVKGVNASWYCHHYRLPNEHYHHSMRELEACTR